MNHKVPNGSMKDSRYSKPAWLQPDSAANDGALKPNWIVTHSR
jgi:hypothetical protein